MIAGGGGFGDMSPPPRVFGGFFRRAFFGR
jgi:hypothetical protein